MQRRLMEMVSLTVNTKCFMEKKCSLLNTYFSTLSVGPDFGNLNCRFRDFSFCLHLFLLVR